MFRRPTVRYGDTPPPRRRYKRPNRPGTIASALPSSRRRTGVSPSSQTGACGGMAAGWYWQSARGTVVPWVVQVDKLGNVASVGPATANYPADRPGHRPRSRQLHQGCPQHLGRRSVVRQDWLDAYKYLTDKGKLALNDYAQHNDPFAKIGKEQVAVEVTSVIRASDESFRVEWIERHYVDGALAATERWSAILTVVIQPPHDKTNLNLNPLGIYIDAINWSKELD